MSGKVIVLDQKMLKSKAYRGLTSTAKDVLMDFMMKRQVSSTKDHKGRKVVIVTNNGHIEYTYSEAEKKGITRQTFARCLDSLVERGFIDIAHSGQGGSKGDKSRYALSDRWLDWETDKFKSGQRPKDKRKGIGFNKYWEGKKAGNADVTPSSNTNVTPVSTQGDQE